MTSPTSKNDSSYYPEALFPSRSHLIPVENLAKGIAKVLCRSHSNCSRNSGTGFCIRLPNTNTNKTNPSTETGKQLEKQKELRRNDEVPQLALVTNYHLIADRGIAVTREFLQEHIENQMEVFFNCIEYNDTDFFQRRNSIVKLDTNIYFEYSDEGDWACIGLRVTKESAYNPTMMELDGGSDQSDSSDDDSSFILPEPIDLSNFIPSVNQIIQIWGHPEGGKLQTSFDQIESYLPGEGIIFHSVSTNRGSSG